MISWDSIFVYHCTLCFVVTDVPVDPSEAIPDAPNCEDMDQHCEAWSTLGECEKNPQYMLVNCAKACRVCETESKIGQNSL